MPTNPVTCQERTAPASPEPFARVRQEDSRIVSLLVHTPVRNTGGHHDGRSPDNRTAVPGRVPGMSITVAAGTRVAGLEEARLAVAGYAFGTRPVPSGRRKEFRGAFGQEQAPRWGYRTYDCIPASAGDAVSDLDVLVAAGLNGHLDVASVGALQLAARRAAVPLAEASRAGVDFADLAYGELGDDPPPGSTGWFLARAWRQMMATPHVKTALTHKVLHHKQPALFPLLDNRTAAALTTAPGGPNAWQQIYAEINGARQEFEDLRSWFARIAASRHGVALSLPRLHDILLWLHTMGQWRHAMDAGQAALNGHEHGGHPSGEAGVTGLTWSACTVPGGPARS
jgi:Family of unknown function (DUF6308)